MKRLIISLGLCSCLTSCLMGPNYQPPSTEVGDGWSAVCQAADPASPLCAIETLPSPTAWWQLLNDPLLERYIALAATNNKKLLASEALIAQACALKRVAFSELLPHLSADLNVVRTYFSKNGPLFAFTPGGENPGEQTSGLPFQIQIPQTQNLYNALLDVRWELDLFGKRRRGVEVAVAQVGSAIENSHDVLVAILSEVALNYIELRSLQQMGSLLDELVALWEKNTEIRRRQLETGIVTQLDVSYSEAQQFIAAANLPTLMAQICQNIYALSVLIGELPETLFNELMIPGPLPCPPETIAIGIRSDVLRRRPDIRKAERDLAAAVANVGVAVASFFPSITLLGDVGLQSLSISDLFEARSLTYAIGGFINIPIFQGGKLVGNLQANEAQTVNAAFTYQHTVLAALREAETSLKAYQENLRTTQFLEEAFGTLSYAAYINSMLETQGLSTMIDVIAAEIQKNQAAQNVTNAKSQSLFNLIAIYQALGGGWEMKGN